MIAIAFILLQLNFFQKTISVLGSDIQINFLDIPICLAGFFTLASGIGYVMRGIFQLQAAGHGDAK